MSNVVVVYHSGYGHTGALAEAVAKGARSVAGTNVLLLPVAEAEARESELEAADSFMSGRITPQLIGEIVGLIPDAWLDDEPTFATKAAHRDAYRNYLTRRLQTPRAFAMEAVRARSQHV